jgi:hypothetical protein
VTSDACSGPLRHGPSADRGGAVLSVANASRHFPSSPTMDWHWDSLNDGGLNDGGDLVVVGTERLPADLANGL